MSAVNDRCLQVERRLVDLGIPGRVEGVGAEGAIALIRLDGGVDEGLLAEGREGALEACLAAGFRYAALELFWE